MKLLCAASQAESTSTGATVSLGPRRNAFEVLISAASSRRSKLPERLTAHNKKDALFNDLIDLFDWCWADSGNTLGKSFLLMLRDVLYIDGHHSVFQQRSLVCWVQHS